MAGQYPFQLADPEPAKSNKPQGRPRRVFVVNDTKAIKPVYSYSCRYSHDLFGAFVEQEGARSAEAAVRHFGEAHGYEPGSVVVLRSDGQRFIYHILA